MDKRLRAALVFLTGLMILERDGIPDEDGSTPANQSSPADSRGSEAEGEPETAEDAGDSDSTCEAMMPDG